MMQTCNIHNRNSAAAAHRRVSIPAAAELMEAERAAVAAAAATAVHMDTCRHHPHKSTKPLAGEQQQKQTSIHPSASSTLAATTKPYQSSCQRQTYEQQPSPAAAADIHTTAGQL
jgi:L-lysine 2,3-aminomutase